MKLICVLLLLVATELSNAQYGATVHLTPTSGMSTAGTLRLHRHALGVRIQGTVSGLLPGKHGFHVHATGDIGNNCVAAGGHFNPLRKSHGGPEDLERHAGDLGNIIADSSGKAHVDIDDYQISLDPNSQSFIGGLAIVIHAGADDLGRGGNAGSLSTGNAGARIGCGKIICDTPQQRETKHVVKAQQITAARGLQTAMVEMVPGVNRTSGSLRVVPMNGGILITGKIFGLSPGYHGFHVHQNGRTGNKCTDAGGHFNPFQRTHGSPDSQERHVGDLGNIFADNFGVTKIEIFDDHSSLDPLSPAYIGNRAFVVHVSPDDLGRGGNDGSTSTGNAGARAGCGVIEVVRQQQPLTHPDDGFQSDFKLANVQSATSEIVPGSGQVKGHLEISEDITGVSITGRIEGLTPGLHGFHVHMEGALGNGCVDAGGHFNPSQRSHGDPKGRERHAGDLGNILADDHGVATIHIKDDHISLDPVAPNFIGGRAFVVHANPDDLGRGRNEESTRTGNAGSRLGCGLIVLKDSGIKDTLPGTQPCDPTNFESVLPHDSFFEQTSHSASGPTHIRHEQLFDMPSERAVAAITPGSSMAIKGDIYLSSQFGGVRITGTVKGLTPGKHGFHVHQTGMLGNKCVDAGGHFNPFQNSHGDPTSFERHVGDLGNIVADCHGVAHINIFDDHVSLDSNDPTFIGGRAFVIHAAADDLGRGPNEESLRTGNAGARLGCARITMVNDQTRTAFQAPDAVVSFVPGSDPLIQGSLQLTNADPGVQITGRIMGLTPGLHGFHVHQLGELGNKCVAAGGHFNPFQNNHGSPFDQHRHVGDLGNIEANQHGVADISLYDGRISLDPNSPSYIGGRAFVVHADRDDLGTGGDPGSLRTGNAGARLGCGAVVLAPTTMPLRRQQHIHFPTRVGRHRRSQ